MSEGDVKESEGDVKESEGDGRRVKEMQGE